MSYKSWGAVLAGALLLASPAAQAQGDDAIKTIAQWNASNTTCRNPSAPPAEAVGACERRDVYSKILAQLNQCYGPAGADGPPVWSPCDAAKAARSAERARTIAQFARRGGVFVLPVTLNGTVKTFFVVDSGASNVQIPQEVADELMKNGTLVPADFVAQRNFVVADGRHLNQKIIRLRSVQVGGRTMENVVASVGAPHSQALLGQSVLSRLNWWKIDNVKNAIELEFTGAF